MEGMRAYGPAWRGAIVRVLFLVLVVLAGCDSDRQATTVPETPGASALVGSPIELLALPDAGAEPLVEAIDGARDSIRLKIYLITYDTILDALKRAAVRGVDIRVMIEEDPYGGGDSNRLAAEELSKAGVTVRASPAVFRLTHEKSMVVDDRQAFIMTHNLTYSSFNKNREYQVIVEDPAVVGEISAVFDADWDREVPELNASGLIWSPVNSRGRIQGMIDGARVSLDVEQTSILDDQVVDHLASAADRGVRVRLITPAVIDPGELEYEPLSRLHAAGVAIRFLDDPYVHAKVFLADGAAAMVGSQNMTAASLDQNRELGIVFDDAGAVNRLAGYFLQDWNAATPWMGPSPPGQAGTGLEPPPPGEVVPWQEAPRYQGQTITVEGEIVDTYNAGSIAFLNFSRDRDDFTLVVFNESFQRFPEPPEDLYLGKRVRATGLVKLYQGRPEMVIDGPDQIEILANSSTAPPAAAIQPLDVEGLDQGTATTIAPGSDVVPWEDAGQYVGRRVTVEGDVVRSYNSGKVAFLNFAEDYRGTFTAVIFASAFDQWPEPPDQFYLGKRIRVTGEVKEYQGAPEIIIETPEQVAVVGNAQADVPSTATPAPAISWEEAGEHEGREVTVEGRVVDTYRSDKVIILNFGPRRDDFKVVIFERNWDRWPASPDELYHGRTLRVRGMVQEYESAPEIVVERPQQVELVDGGSEPEVDG